MNENNHDTAEIETPGSPWRRFLSRFVAKPEPSIAHRLYDRLVRHARFPFYYDRLGVPDTPEGRFEILSLHVGLTVRKLYSFDGDKLNGDGRMLGQALFDLMVADLDVNLRELGVGDLSVGKQVKRLAGQFYARLAVLNEVFDEGRGDGLAPMLETNVYGAAASDPEKSAHLARIVTALKEALDSQPLADLREGKISLPDERTLSTLGDPGDQGEVGGVGR
ncbi:MAG: ubiquinol-cytochrome C chaperone family protein [Geminicoccaceae bacterium]